MSYSFTCPSPCNYEVKVEAKDDDQAVEKILMAGEIHRKQVHPELPPLSEGQMASFVRSGMRKGL
jgi:hypothetical protein